jgi:hypothetical protein
MRKTVPALRAIAFASTTALLVAGVSACDSGDLEGVEAEVQPTSVELSLPPVPEFDLPRPNPDGTHSVREMRLQGNRFLGTEVRVKGYVIWVYDCATAIRTAEMSEAELKKVLEEEPERCSRPNLYLGDSRDTPPDRGIWLVEVPRQPRKDELKGLPEDMVREMQEQWSALPPFQVGDEVVATGSWDLTSPKQFSNSDGLLVYKSLQNLTTPAETANR